MFEHELEGTEEEFYPPQVEAGRLQTCLLYTSTQGIALFFRQLLGVVQKFILKVRWQNNSSGVDRTGQTAAV